MCILHLALQRAPSVLPPTDQEARSRTDYFRGLRPQILVSLGRSLLPISCLLCINSVSPQTSWILTFDPLSALNAYIPRFLMVVPILCFTLWLARPHTSVSVHIPAWLPGPRSLLVPPPCFPHPCLQWPQALPGHGLTDPSCPVTIVCSPHPGWEANKPATELCKQALEASLFG